MTFLGINIRQLMAYHSLFLLYKTLKSKTPKYLHEKVSAGGQFPYSTRQAAECPADFSFSVHFKSESQKHYFLDCFLYTLERQRMFSLIEHYVPNFSRLNISQKLDIILNGVDPENLEFTSTNTTITYSVQENILATTRFTAMED